MTQRQQHQLAQKTRLTLSDIAELLLELENTEVDDDSEAEIKREFGAGADMPAGFTIRVRGLHQLASTATRHEATAASSEAIAELLKTLLKVEGLPVAEPIAEWDGTECLACCDVDYHALPMDARPSVDWLMSRAASIQPAPIAYHTSHGRGVKLYYVAHGGYTAHEYAAVAALAWAARDARATVDVARSTRLPRFPRADGGTCGPLQFPTKTDNLEALGAWLQKTLEPDAVEQFLAERGWTVGQMLPHTECPIDPGADTTHATSVHVGDHGLYCHKCYGAGLSLGRSAGFTSYRRLVGGVKPRIASMIANGTHWTHAKMILRADFPRLAMPVLEAAYSAAIKLHHGADSPVAQSVMTAGRDMIRVQGRWTSPDGRTTYTQNSHGLITALPAVWDKCTRVVLNEKRDLFFQAVDLTHHGYPPLSPIHGCLIYGQHLTYPDDRVAYPVPAPWAAHCAPRYRKKRDRMPLGDAWALLETAFPGIYQQRAYVELCIVQKGFAEGGAAQAPFCVVTGPSGSGKSSTVHVAASICGDTASAPLFTTDNVRLMQSFAGALDMGSYIVQDEVFKESNRAGVSPRNALDPILTLTPDTVSHRLYIGPRPLGRLPALILTDIKIPLAVCTDTQLARRLIWVQLNERLNWEPSIQKCGFGRIGHFRAWSAEAAAACDAILSDIIDRFFRAPMTYHEAAEELGYKTLERGGHMVDMRAMLVKFFDAVCAAPDLTGSEKDRRPAPGWKLIKRGDTSELAELWAAIADGEQGDAWKESRQAQSEDWAQLLGVKAHVQLEVANYRSNVYVRFKVGPTKAPEWASVNGCSQLS